MRRLVFCLAAGALVAAACTSSGTGAQPSPPPASFSSPSSGSPSPSGGPPPRWIAIATPAITGRISDGVVWTGAEMIVWGGVSRGNGTAEQLADGAAYDPATDSWRTLAAAPAGLKGGGGRAAAWTGSTAVFWVGNSPDGPVGGAVYDPAADSWRKLRAGPLGVREGYISVWTGKRLLILGGVAGDQLATPIGAGVDPKTGSWKLLTSLNKLTGFLPTGAVWDGKEAFLFGHLSLCPQLGSSCRKYRPLLVSYAPGSDTARQISLKNAPVSQKTMPRLVPTAWTGNEVLFTDVTNSSAEPVLYDPAGNAWRVGHAAPCAPTAPAFSQTAWIDGLLVAPCEKGRLQVYDPGADTWQILAAGPSPLNSRALSSVVWTGTELISWSGLTSQPFSPTVRTGAAIDLSTLSRAAPGPF